MQQNTRLSEKLCSVLAKSYGEDPGGTAAPWDRCLIIEVPKPWESDVEESRHFPEGVSQVLARGEERGTRVKLQCVEPDPDYSVDGHRRVMYFSRPKGPFARYRRDEFVVPSSEVTALAETLVAGQGKKVRFEKYRQDSSHIRDMLVCTHGTHDVCCGTFGYPIYEALRQRYVPEFGGRLRVWQVSHIGGHRLAPNVIDLPEGRYWCRMGADDLRSLVYREGPVSGLRTHYRGCVALGSPAEQIAEREAFVREGWAWTGLQISSRLAGGGDGASSTQVRIEFTDHDGAKSGAYEATVEHCGSVAKASCMHDGAGDQIDQYSVSRLVRVGQRAATSAHGGPA